MSAEFTLDTLLRNPPPTACLIAENDDRVVLAIPLDKPVSRADVTAKVDVFFEAMHRIGHPAVRP
jgi:hypothetical protein